MHNCKCNCSNLQLKRMDILKYHFDIVSFQVLWAWQGSANRVTRVSQAHLDIMGQREREDTLVSRVNRECAIHQCATARCYEEIRSVKDQTIESAWIWCCSDSESNSNSQSQDNQECLPLVDTWSTSSIVNNMINISILRQPLFFCVIRWDVPWFLHAVCCEK